MSTREQPNRRSLTPIRDRERRSRARKVQSALKERAMDLLRELVPNPTNFCEISSSYGVSRGRNHARDNHIYHVYQILADVAAESDDPVGDLYQARAEIGAVITLLLDRVVGIRGEMDLMERIEAEARAGAAQDVVVVEALSDGEIDAEEARELDQRSREQIATLHGVRRSLALEESRA